MDSKTTFLYWHRLKVTNGCLLCPRKELEGLLISHYKEVGFFKKSLICSHNKETDFQLFISFQGEIPNKLKVLQLSYFVFYS